MSMPALSLWQPWASLLVTRQPWPFCSYEHEADAECEGCGWAWCTDPPMVKRFETRSWPCPPSLIGQRFAIHAAARRPDRAMRVGDFRVEAWHDVVRHVEDCYCDPEEIAPACSMRSSWRPRMRRREHDEWIDLQLGAVVGSGVVAACYPIVGEDGDLFAVDGSCIEYRPEGAMNPGLWLWDDTSEADDPIDISDQFPYGDFTPGRYAWLIEDAAPTTERCPWCWGTGMGEPARDVAGLAHTDCPVCERDVVGSNGGAPLGRCEPIPAKGRQRIWHWTPEAA